MKPVSLALALSTAVLSHSAAAQDDALKAKAEVIIVKSCGACHDQSMDAAFVDAQGAVDWDAVKNFADKIVTRVSATTRPMPPPRAPASLQLTAEEKTDLIAYAKSLVTPPSNEEPEIAPLSKLKVEPGFKIEVFAQAQGARSLTVHPSGIVFIGTGGFSDVDPQGRVYAVVPTETGRKVVALLRGLDNPNGVTVHGDDLFIAEQSRVILVKDAVGAARQLASGSAIRVGYDVIKDDLRRQGNHSWKYLAVGPDNKLYVPVGADCNVCDEDRDVGAAIFRMNLDGSGYEQVAKGVRNTVGFAFHPETKELWFTDNGRDSLGDNLPPDELNILSSKTNGVGDFGFPFCFGSTVTDPQFGRGIDCNGAPYIKPARDLGAHVAALGMAFYTGSSFPAAYKNQAFVAEHGSWNSSRKVGYRLSIVESQVNEQGVVTRGYRPFISGWVDDAGKTNWGRPVDVKNYIDGSLLLSDDNGGLVYRISYVGQ